MDIGRQLLKILRQLEDKWLEMFGEDIEEVRRLVQAGTQVQDADLSPIINDLLKKVSQHPNAKGELKPYFSGYDRLYDPTPGKSGPIEPGMLMVCPIDPTHYQKYLRQKGQRFVCPEHGLDLVPALD